MRTFDNPAVLSFLFMLPAATLLLVFLTYPLGLGIWLGFTDTRIGRAGVFIGLENYQSLFRDSMFWLAVSNTVLYTVIATIGKFALGLWLALLLNRHLPFKNFFRAIILLPWVVPTVQAHGATCATGTPFHSWQLTAQGKTPAAHKGLEHVAKVMAGTALDALRDPALIEKAKADHRARLAETPFVNPIPDDVQPPLTMAGH